MHVRCRVHLPARWGCPLPGRSTPLGPMTGMGAVSAGSLCSPAVIEWFDRFAAAGLGGCSTASRPLGLAGVRLLRGRWAWRVFDRFAAAGLGGYFAGRVFTRVETR